ncbi:MAG: thermonuclease family protein [Aphanocapsa sp. GSE-SYN-MK-11-07L]|jgi:endonuclease YncB( thermonuclease family)|nr:thermonuclease family protein [Aphanocapsa sp. GSE-SYN-MK-11-07L]
MKQVFLLILTLLLTSCFRSPASSSAQPTVGINQTPNQTPSLVWSVVPQSVHDGDTIKVERQGQTLKIRFCGIDAPELKQPQGEQARNYLRSLLNQSGNQVQINPVDTDRYGRTVAEVFRRQQGKLLNVNAEMTEAGWAYYYAQYANHCLQKTAIATAETEAKRQKRGVWKNAKSVRPWDWRKNHS